MPAASCEFLKFFHLQKLEKTAHPLWFGHPSTKVMKKEQSHGWESQLPRRLFMTETRSKNLEWMNCQASRSRLETKPTLHNQKKLWNIKPLKISQESHPNQAREMIQGLQSHRNPPTHIPKPSKKNETKKKTSYPQRSNPIPKLFPKPHFLEGDLNRQEASFEDPGWGLWNLGKERKTQGFLILKTRNPGKNI